MKDEFFSEIKVPNFLKKAFEEKELHEIIRDLKLMLEENIEDKHNSDISHTSHSGEIYVGENSIISDFVTIQGPVYIGSNVQIGPSSFIRPGSVISDNCQLNHATHIKNSVMMEGSKMSNHAMLGDSIIGADARLGGHSETMNRRFDQKEIEFIYKDKRIKTGLDKLGLILGESSRIGGGTYSAPGTMIGKNTFVSSVIQVSGFIPKNSFVKASWDTEIKENRFSGKLNSKYNYL